jgi:hypothetical protein
MHLRIQMRAGAGQPCRMGRKDHDAWIVSCNAEGGHSRKSRMGTAAQLLRHV